MKRRRDEYGTGLEKHVLKNKPLWKPCPACEDGDTPGNEPCLACKGLGLHLGDKWFDSPAMLIFLIPTVAKSDGTFESYQAVLERALTQIYTSGEGYRIVPLTHPSMPEAMHRIELFMAEQRVSFAVESADSLVFRVSDVERGETSLKQARIVLLEHPP